MKYIIEIFVLGSPKKTGRSKGLQYYWEDLHQLFDPSHAMNPVKVGGSSIAIVPDSPELEIDDREPAASSPALPATPPPGPKPLKNSKSWSQQLLKYQQMRDEKLFDQRQEVIGIMRSMMENDKKHIQLFERFVAAFEASVKKE